MCSIAYVKVKSYKWVKQESYLFVLFDQSTSICSALAGYAAQE